MDRIKIHGRVGLQGKVRIQGSKNAVLPVLAAILLTEGETVLENVPKITDVFGMLEILRCMGCSIRFCGNEIKISHLHSQQRQQLPDEAIRAMRSSMYLMGALLGRYGRISMGHPGGCVIGERPIDLHIKALTQMGVRFCETDHKVEGYVRGRLHGAEIRLDFPSVGATENVILAGVLAEGCTVLSGAAKEPEIVALCRFLTCCGASIRGMGTDKIVINGVERLEGCRFRIPGDRIVAGTYLLMTAATGGAALLTGVCPGELDAVITLTRKMGCDCQTIRNGIYVQAPEMLRTVESIETDVYPGFPTDLQSVAVAAALRIPGETCIRENIFENRFQILPELEAMGARIRKADCRTVYVCGGNRLSGCKVEAKELRGGASLVAAGLLAEGLTTVSGLCYIDRGYENICKDLRELGARIYREK